jgi:ATP-binding cassette subfamily B protein
MTGHDTYHEEERRIQAFDRHLFLRLMSYLKPYYPVVAAGLLLLFVNAALEISLTFLVQIGIDDYIANQDTDGFRMIILLYLGAILLGLAVASGQLYLTMWLGQKVQHDIRTQLFAHLQKLPTSFLDRNPIGRLVTRVTGDVGTLNELFSTGVVTILGDLLSLVLIVAALLYYNWQLALLTFVVLPFLVTATVWFRTRIRHQYRELRLRLARLNAFVQEHVTGIEQVQLLGREQHVRNRLAGFNRRVRSTSLKSVYYSALFLPTAEIIGALSIAILLHAGGMKVLDSVLTFGELVAFINLVERFYQPIQSLSEEYGVLHASMASSERIFQILDTPPESTGPEVMPNSRVERTTIAFEHVWFAYKDEDWVLKDVTFRIEPGETVAIVGATGAGKTSLASLLFRFYEPQRGRITLSDVPLRDLPIAFVRSQLGLVLQDGFLFSGTVAENVRGGNTALDDEDVLAALEAVRFFETGLPLHDGVGTVLGQGGAALSSGQRQLLAMARVLAHDPKVLILDEATSSVDIETERQIDAAVDRARQGRTAIIIAHRLATVRKADRILVMHHGALHESGTHAELMALNGLYRRLYQLQFETNTPSVTRS